tara:strand:+ start:1629 stop:1931 length:303 start_codon:yes stop_codon:yes gene_type:complete
MIIPFLSPELATHLLCFSEIVLSFLRVTPTPCAPAPAPGATPELAVSPTPGEEDKGEADSPPDSCTNMAEMKTDSSEHIIMRAINGAHEEIIKKVSTFRE